MRSFVIKSGLIGVLLLATGGVNALSLSQDSGPAETPPPSYQGNQYVDSRGCVYIRSGIGASVRWVPRVTRDRQVICNARPSNVGSSNVGSSTVTRPAPVSSAPVASAPVPAPSSVPTRMIRTAPTTAPTPTTATPAPVVRTAPQPTGFIQRAAPGSVATSPSFGDPVSRRSDVFPGSMVDTSIPDGYRAAWDDGRLNNQRGLRADRAPMITRLNQTAQSVSQTAPLQTVTSQTVTSAPNVIHANSQPRRTTLPQQRVREGHRFVQVAIFGVPANAQRTSIRLGGMGMSVKRDIITQGGRELTMISVGPFSDLTELRAALEKIRAMGFTDAFSKS